MKNIDLHTYLKKVCVIKNMTLAEIARKSGMSATNLNGIMNNNNTTLLTLSKIAEAIDCNLDINFIDKSTGEILRTDL